MQRGELVSLKEREREREGSSTCDHIVITEDNALNQMEKDEQFLISLTGGIYKSQKSKKENYIRKINSRDLMSNNATNYSILLYFRKLLRHYMPQHAHTVYKMMDVLFCLFMVDMQQCIYISNH
jgi:hypothetical protein